MTMATCKGPVSTGAGERMAVAGIKCGFATSHSAYCALAQPILGVQFFTNFPSPRGEGVPPSIAPQGAPRRQARGHSRHVQGGRA